ncbi:catechol 2,3-dioxygenase [Azotobacter beijerinckii]|uniref:catechol 2,3-dioxygenase n=1 Tax=Azotobacter beijerinckii TaxID=170623 RepID=UPI002953B8C5|nr:catechol 2,3-dioxygenase [Azotobacter beijerinckii]MDV7211414.1 catechol 2,3-dioxygenase [Azotobacter beijerinckii]
MAMTGVLRPGHTQLRVLNLEESVKFYTDVLGLVETGRDAAGRVYFKCHDERDHHSFIIRESDRSGMDFYGFKVLDKATLDRLEADLRNYGVVTERIPAGDLLETGERVRFEIPTGHLIELYAEKKEIGDSLGYVNPDVIIEGRKGISPLRLDHWQIHGSDLDGSRDLFTQVLGFSLVERILGEDGKTDMAVWLSCSTKAHDIAFVRDERNNTVHHASFLLDTWEHVLRAADIMTKHRVSIDIGPLRHGITRGTTIYAFDPSGNRFETFCGGYDFYPDMKPYTWTWDEIGTAIFYHTRELNERFLTVVT